MSAPLSPIPSTDAPVDPATNFLITHSWYIWLYEIWSRIRSNITLVGSAFTRSSQTAAIVAATVYTTTQAGLYRISYYIRVTTLPTTSFSLTVTIGWREGGVTKSQTFAALVGAPGTLATAFQCDQIPVQADSGTVITMSVAYASVGAQAAVYAVNATTELVS